MFVDPPLLLPPPDDEAKRGPDNFKTDDKIPPNAPPDPPPELLSPSSPFVAPAPDELEPPKNDPLNEPNFCVSAEILGVMTADIKVWKLGIG